MSPKIANEASQFFGNFYLLRELGGGGGQRSAGHHFGPKNDIFSIFSRTIWPSRANLGAFESPEKAFLLIPHPPGSSFSFSKNFEKSIIFDPKNGLGFRTLQSYCGTTRRAFGLRLCMLIVHMNKAFVELGAPFCSPGSCSWWKLG